MSTLEPGPQKFAFGPIAVGPTRPSVEPSDLVYLLADAGAWGVGLLDDDLAPPAASPAERHDVMDRLTKALDSTALAASAVTTNFHGHPMFSDGAFTSADRDVRRAAIQKVMRALDVGAEVGAQLHVLRAGVEGTGCAAARCPLDAIDRYREAVDFLAAYVSEQGYSTRLALGAGHTTGRGDTLLPTTGHALAFIGTLADPGLVGLSPQVGHGPAVADGRQHDIAQVIDARKLFRTELNAPSSADPDQDLSVGSTSLREAFLIVKLLEETGYDGPLHVDISAGRVEGPHGIAEFAIGCMRTYRALAAKARRFADDPEIRDALTECGALELAEPSVGPFSAEAAMALSAERFDAETLAERCYGRAHLDQLVTDLVLGLR
jgi:xylose isomerase